MPRASTSRCPSTSSSASPDAAFHEDRNGHALDLRSITDAESHNHQALRLGQWTFEDEPEDRPVVVTSTIGGSVLVVDPSTALGTPLTLQAVTSDAKGLHLSLPVDFVIGFPQCCIP